MHFVHVGRLTRDTRPESRMHCRKIGFASLFLFVGVILTFAPISTARAAKPCPNAGYCAPGTCADNGDKRACNIKRCSAKNCRK